MDLPEFSGILSFDPSGAGHRGGSCVLHCPECHGGNPEGAVQSAVNEVGVSFNRELKEAQNAGYYVGKEKRLSSYLMKAGRRRKSRNFIPSIRSRPLIPTMP